MTTEQQLRELGRFLGVATRFAVEYFGDCKSDADLIDRLEKILAWVKSNRILDPDPETGA